MIIRRLCTTPLAKTCLFTLGLLAFQLIAHTDSHAKSIQKVSRHVVIASTEQPSTRVVSDADLRTTLLKALAHNPKAAKAFAKCTSVSTSPAPSFWSCLKYCMADVGVSPASLIICAATCAAAATGAGAIVCAVCLGVSVTVVQVCALGCAMYGDGPVMEENVSRKSKRPLVKPGAKRKTLPIPEGNTV